MKLASLSLATLFGAAALVSTAAMAPASDVTPALLVQEQKKAVSITGVCIGSDGQPAAKIPVVAMFSRPMGAAGGGGTGGGGGAGDPDRLASFQNNERRGRWTVIGKAITDESGRFTIKNVREQGNLRVDIGDKFRSDWAIVTNVRNDGKKETIDMGEIKLQAKLQGGPQGGGR